MNPVRYVDFREVAVIRAALREALSNPTIMKYDRLTMAIACQELGDSLRQQAIADEISSPPGGQTSSA